MDANAIKDDIKSIVASAVPDKTVVSVETIRSYGLHQLYLVTGEQGVRLLCSLPPLPSTRVLRCEYASVRAEAAILQWLATRVENLTIENLSITVSTADLDEKKTEWLGAVRQLSAFIPELIEYGSATLPHRTSYSITTCLPGDVISSLTNPLNPLERRYINFQVGQFIRRVSFVCSPTGRFGNAEDILPPVPAKSNWAQRRTAAQHLSATYTRWSEAFAAMVNTAIKDAQSNHITASYDGIRRCIRRFTAVLDSVTEPRLVIVDAGLDHTVLVRRMPGMTSEQCSDSYSSCGVVQEPNTRIQITGVREWIKSVFGDPLLAAAFSNRQQSEIFRGFIKPLDDVPRFDIDVCDDCAEHPKDIQIRLLLYETYHALNAITVEYLRRDSGSDPREMQARKALLEALKKLDSIEEVEVSKRRHVPKDLVPAKRLKTRDLSKPED